MWGATVPLFLTEPGAPPPRSTRDVDVIAQIASRKDYYQLSDELQKRGFSPDVDSPVICHWKFNDLIVDVMPTDSSILGFSNRWYEDAIQFAQDCLLDEGVSILLVTPPHFIATKIEAFLGRGNNDFMGSTDMEDIVTILDGRGELVDEIEACNAKLRQYLKAAFSDWLTDGYFVEALSGHLLPDAASQARMPLLLERIKRVASMGW